MEPSRNGPTCCVLWYGTVWNRRGTVVEPFCLLCFPTCPAHSHCAYYNIIIKLGEPGTVACRAWGSSRILIGGPGEQQQFSVHHFSFVACCLLSSLLASLFLVSSLFSVVPSGAVVALCRSPLQSWPFVVVVVFSLAPFSLLPSLCQCSEHRVSS